MRILVLAEDAFNSEFLVKRLKKDRHEIVEIDREYSVLEMLRAMARQEQAFDMIIMVDERMPFLTTNQVREFMQFGGMPPLPGSYRDAGVRLCETARDLGLLAQGVLFICGSVLFTDFDYEIHRRISTAGGLFVPIASLEHEVRRFIQARRR